MFRSPFECLRDPVLELAKDVPETISECLRDSVLKLSKDVSEVLSERLRDLVLKVSKDVPEKLWLPGELIAGKIAAAGRIYFRKSSNCGWRES